MKLKIIVLSLFLSLTFLKIEGMEKRSETLNLSQTLIGIPVSYSSSQNEATLRYPVSLQPSLHFGPLFDEKIEQDPLETAALYIKILQLGQVQEFEIKIIEICELAIYCDEGKPIPPTIQRFKNQYETLKFLQFIEKPVNKYQSYLMEFRKDYEKKLKNTELEFEREQLVAISKISEFYNRIKNRYNTVALSRNIESIINTFKIVQCDNFNSLHISIEDDKDIEYAVC